MLLMKESVLNLNEKTTNTFKLPKILKVYTHKILFLTILVYDY